MFFFNDTAPTEIYTLSLHDALPISRGAQALVECGRVLALMRGRRHLSIDDIRELAPAVLRHRVILNFDAHADDQTPDKILEQILLSIPTAGD